MLLLLAVMYLLLSTSKIHHTGLYAIYSASSVTYISMRYFIIQAEHSSIFSTPIARFKETTWQWSSLNSILACPASFEIECTDAITSQASGLTLSTKHLHLHCTIYKYTPCVLLYTTKQLEWSVMQVTRNQIAWNPHFLLLFLSLLIGGNMINYT